MYKRTLFLMLLSACILCAQSQGKTGSAGTVSSFTARQAMADALQPAPKQDSSSRDLTAFVPRHHAILDTVFGDLNLDANPDVILVLKKKGEDTVAYDDDHPQKRPLLILIGQPDKSYKLAAQSDNAVYCFACGGVLGDPFTGVKIKKGSFSVEHSGGSADRWTRIITFKYSPSDNDWYLYKDRGDDFNAAKPKKKKTTIYKEKDFGKVPFDKFDIYKER